VPHEIMEAQEEGVEVCPKY